MNSNVENIVEQLNTIQDVKEITDIIRDPRIKKIINETSISDSESRFNQRGGVSFLGGVIQGLLQVIMAVLKFVLNFFKDIAKELFAGPWRQSNRALFWKYVWFCIKCGLYLLVFALAGPIFIVIGIGMVYSKMLAKMKTDGPTLVRERLADARSV